MRALRVSPLRERGSSFSFLGDLCYQPGSNWKLASTSHRPITKYRDNSSLTFSSRQQCVGNNSAVEYYGLPNLHAHVDRPVLRRRANLRKRFRETLWIEA